MTATAASSPRRFEFERDTFAYPHELVWQYRFDPVTGAMTTFKTDPPPTYYHCCFVMARSTRQFFYHARFAPELPLADAETYRKLIREIVRRNPRCLPVESERITEPEIFFNIQGEPSSSHRAFHHGKKTALCNPRNGA